MEKDSFEQVYSQYYKVVYAYLLTLCRSEELAADLAQETFYKALRGIDRFQQECPLNVWLCSIAKHALVDHYRRHRKEAQPEQMPDLPDEDPLPGQRLEERQAALALYKALHGLPEPYREVFWLRVYGELSFAEIGALHGKTETWARVTYYRARTKLKEALP